MNSKSILAVFKDQEEFLPFCEDIVSNSKKAQTLSKIIAEFPQNKRGELWRNALQAVRENAASNPKVFNLACVLITAWLDANDKEQIPPASLIDLVAESHDALFELHAESEIQNDVSKVCERWYLESRPGRDRVLPQLVPTVILQSLQGDGAPTRAFNLRETLFMFDLEDESSFALKKLLLQCFVSPPHLNSTQGRKFLAFVMALSEELMLAAHDSMKNQLVQLKGLKSDRRTDAISNFARIYYGVWQNLKRERPKEDDDVREKKAVLLETFERDIVQQDFMNGSIFYRDDAMAKLCLKMLNAAFHDNKKDRSVDSMLARRYEPIIWLGLSAVNASVRKNAAVVLFNAFPLHDPEAKLEEISKSLHRQFEAIATLLMDPCPEVRVTAIEGVCRVLAFYWETIPAQKSSKYLQTLVNDLAHDKTAPIVRAAVLRSLAYMLDYPLSQPALKIALPHLRKHLNDRSQLVRVEMAKLLVKVDSTSGFRFTDVCSPGSILTQLVEDKEVAQVTTPLCQLLAPSFFPVESPSIEQLKRAKSLASTNFNASQVFFRNLHRFVEVNKVAKLALLFGSFVRARKREIDSTEFESEEDKQDEVEKACDEIYISIETICVLWESVAKPVAHDEQFAAARESLLQTFGQDSFILPLFEWKPFGEKYEGSLLRLCALVPCEKNGHGQLASTSESSNASALERKIIRSIFLSQENCSLLLERKVDLVVEWNRYDRVLKEIVRSLTIYMTGEKDIKRKVNSQVALRILNQLLSSLSKRQLIEKINSNRRNKSKRVEHQSEEDRDGTSGTDASDEEEKRIKRQQEAENDELEADNHNWLIFLIQNLGLQSLFELARPKVTAEGVNEMDEIAVALILFEIKLSVHFASSKLLLQSSRVSLDEDVVSIYPAPQCLIDAVEWCSQQISKEGDGGALINATGNAKTSKKKKAKANTGETSAAASLLFEDIDDQEDEKDSSNGVVTSFLDGVLNLAADASALGLDILESSVTLIDACLNADGFGKVLPQGLGRLIFQLKLAFPSDGRLDELLRGAYRACEDTEEVENILAQLFQKLPEKTFTSVIIPLFQDGFQLFAGKPLSLYRAFMSALAALKAEPENEMLLSVVQYFAKGASTTKMNDVSKELTKFSERCGGLVGDMLYNLAHELKDSSTA